MNKNNKRYTFEEVKEIFINNGYVPLFNNYKTNKEKLLCQSITDRYKGFICLNSLLCGQKIAWFHNSNPYTIENIKRFIANNYIDCELISDKWISSTENLRFLCKLCKKEFAMPWQSFQKGKTKCCFNCSNIKNAAKRRISYESVLDEFYKRGYIVLSDKYLDNKQRLIVKDIYGYKGLLSYHQLMGGNGFDKFHPKNPYTIDNIKHYISINNLSAEYCYGIYKNNESTLTFKCDCGEYFSTSWASFTNLNKTKCSACSKSMSKLELLISKWLTKNNINFQTQFKFDDCRNIVPLRFDFCVELDKDKILIECQGIQHFEPVEYFGGLDGFLYRIKNDTIKRDYCNKNNIKLLEISYLDFKNNNYKNILQEELIL